MSIIHEALKKAQQSMQALPSKNASKEADRKTETLSSVNKKTKPKFTLLLIIFLLMVIALGASFVYLQIQNNYRPLSKAIVKIETPTPQPVPDAVPVKPVQEVPLPAVPLQEVPVLTEKPAPPLVTESPAPTAIPEALNIQGIMKNNGHNVALINNNIYEEGDVIKEKKILRIDLNAITVEENGQQEVLLITK